MPWQDVTAALVAGEVDASVRDQIDSDAARLGCKWMENFYTLPQGGIRTRPGTIMLEAVQGIAGLRSVVPDIVRVNPGAATMPHPQPRFDDKNLALNQAALVGNDLVRFVGVLPSQTGGLPYRIWTEDEGAYRLVPNVQSRVNLHTNHVSAPLSDFIDETNRLYLFMEWPEDDALTLRTDAVLLGYAYTVQSGRALSFTETEPSQQFFPQILDVLGLEEDENGAVGWVSLGTISVGSATLPAQRQEQAVVAPRSFHVPASTVAADRHIRAIAVVGKAFEDDDGNPVATGVNRQAYRGRVWFTSVEVRKTTESDLSGVSTAEPVRMKEISFDQENSSLAVFVRNSVTVYEIDQDPLTGGFSLQPGLQASIPIPDTPAGGTTDLADILDELTFASHLQTLFIFHNRLWPFKALRRRGLAWEVVDWDFAPSAPGTTDAIPVADVALGGDGLPTLSVEAGGPSCGTLYNGRLCIAGNGRYPNGFWFSAQGGLTDFRPRSDDVVATDPGFVLFPGSTTVRINHLIASDRLFLLGDLLANFLASVTLSPETIATQGVRLAASRGAAIGVEPAAFEARVAFVPTPRNALYGLTFSRERQGYIETNLCRLNPRLMRNPADVVWAGDVRDCEPDLLMVVNRQPSARFIDRAAEQANLAVASVDIEAGLFAWYRWTTGYSTGLPSADGGSTMRYRTDSAVMDVEVAGNRLWQAVNRRGTVFIEFYDWSCPLDFANRLDRGQGDEDLLADRTRLRHAAWRFHDYWDMVVEGFAPDHRVNGRRPPGFDANGFYRVHYWDLLIDENGYLVLPFQEDDDAYTEYADADGRAVNVGYRDVLDVRTTEGGGVPRDARGRFILRDGATPIGRRPERFMDLAFPVSEEGWPTVRSVWIGQRFTSRLESLDFVDRRGTGPSAGIIRSTTRMVRVHFQGTPPGYPDERVPTARELRAARYRVNGRPQVPQPVAFVRDRLDPDEMEHQFVNLAGWFNRNTVSVEVDDPCTIASVSRQIET